MTPTEECLPLVELSPAPVIYADGIASALVVGSIVRIVFYEVKRMDGLIVRQPVVELVRPLQSCLELSLQAMLKRNSQAH